MPLEKARPEECELCDVELLLFLLLVLEAIFHVRWAEPHVECLLLVENHVIVIDCEEQA